MEQINQKKISKEIYTVDLMPIVTQLVTRVGRFQLILLLLLSVNSGIVAINHLLTTFHTYSPPEFYCLDNNNTKCEVDNQECDSGYQFIGDTHTIVTEWSLICSKRLLAPLVNTLYFSGVTIGALVCGYLADIWGRKLIVLICLYAQCILGLTLYFSNSLVLFMIIRTIQGFFVQGLQGCTYTLMLEYCAPKHRTMAGVVWEIFWALGLFYLGAMSYFIPDWRYLHLALAIPSILTLTYIWIIPESMCWLVATNKYKKAHKISLKYAKLNGNYEYVNEYKNIPLELVSTDINNQQKPAGVLEVIKNKILRKHTLIMLSVWFSVTLSYYGILFYLPSLAGERHLNFVIGGLIECLAYIFAYFILTRYGRRIPMILYQYVNGIICIIIGIITIFVTQDDDATNAWKDPLIIFLTLIAKGLAVSCFCGMFIYTSELFPTVCRAASLGLCGFFARIGSLVAPQLMLLSDLTHESVPMILMGLLILFTGTGTIFLPETLHLDLPNTVKESDEIWSK